MQVPESLQPIVPAPSAVLVDDLSFRMQPPVQRLFVGSSAGVVTMVPAETAEHHHMGD
jgi:hypothetical protein